MCLGCKVESTPGGKPEPRPSVEVNKSRGRQTPPGNREIHALAIPPTSASDPLWPPAGGPSHFRVSRPVLPRFGCLRGVLHQAPDWAAGDTLENISRETH